MEKKDGEAKPRGRMSSYAFFLQTCREEHKKKHPNDTVVFTEFSKKCAEKWKEMTPKEKKRFEDMAERDKARYEREMSSYIPAGGQSKKRKWTKDPNPPKRVLRIISQSLTMEKKDGEAKPRGRMSSYAFFLQTCREEHKKKHPNDTVVFTEFSKKCAEKWKEMTPKEKKRFEDMAERDKARYEREMSSYIPAGGQSKKRKWTKDPNPPKRVLRIISQSLTMEKKDGEAKPRGRMSSYAFFLQTCREEHKKKHPNDTVVFTEFSKKCAEKWKEMTPKEKKRFEDMAERDKARYEREMSSYIPAGGQSKKRKWTKDPNPPKRVLRIISQSLTMEKKDGEAKPRGRMSSYAFFLQTCREEHKKKHPNDTVVFTEFSKKCAEKWKEMTPKEKKRFEDMAERDKARYEREMSSYIPAGGQSKKRKWTKDPNPPKRVLSACFFFYAEERPSVRAANPGISAADVAKELGKRWEVCPKKPKFEQLANEDKARYERDMAAYRGGGGASSGPKASPKKAKVEDDDEEEEEDDEDDDE